MRDPDRRRNPRRPPPAWPRLRCNYPLRLLDLGCGVARLETSEWLAPGRCCALRLPALDLRLVGAVVRCGVVRVETTRPAAAWSTRPAVRFEGLRESDRDRLGAVVAALGGQRATPRGQLAFAAGV